MTETYSDLLYRTSVGIRNNNCYAWAIDFYRNAGEDKLQPGELAGITTPVDLRDCKDLRDRVLADGKAMGWDIRYLGLKDKPAPPGFVKIVALLAPGVDFHFMRFNKDVLYRVKTARSVSDIAREFGVPHKRVTTAKFPITSGDLILIRDANCWSQKNGFSPEGPLLRDACGRVVKDIDAACRDFGNGLNYRTVCGYFALKK